MRKIDENRLRRIINEAVARSINEDTDARMFNNNIKAFSKALNFILENGDRIREMFEQGVNYSKNRDFIDTLKTAGRMIAESIEEIQDIYG